MPGLQVLSAPQNQPTLSPTVQSAPTQPTLAPRVLSAPTNAPTLAPKVVTQPTQPTLNPQVQPPAQGKITSVGTSTDQQPYTQKLSLQEFGQLVKQQYPAYEGKDDVQLAQAMLQKYPQYQDRIYTPSKQDEQYSLGGFLANIPKSGATAIGNLVTAVLHPVDTIEGAAKILYGALNKNGGADGFLNAVNPILAGANKLVPDSYKQQSAVAIDSTIQFFKNRYGSIENLKKTAYKDPVGFLIDLSTLLDAGGSALKSVGDVSQISELSKAGEIASKAGEITNPVNAGLKVIGKAANLGADTLGAVTGAGGGAIKEAVTNPSAGYWEALYGKTSPEEIVAESKSALRGVKADRASTYQSQLADIKNAPATLDLTPLKSELQTQLTKYGIGTDEKGNLVFDNSTVSDPSEQSKIQSAYQDINRWDRTPSNVTPAGMDTLKRRLDNLYSPNSDVRSFVTSLKSSTRQILNDNVPGYAEMTKHYQEATSFIDEVTKGLSLGDKTSADTALRKLASALKQNNEFRTQLVKQLQEVGGKDITGKIAGYNLSSLIPRSIVGKGADILALYGLAHAINPAMLAGLAASSPKLVGTVLGGFGLTAKAATSVVDKLGAANMIGPATKAAYQLGRLKNQ